MKLLRRLTRNRLALVGLVGVLLLLVVAVAGPVLAPYDPSAPSPDQLQPPGAAHLMGTDNFGRDTFSRWLAGTRVSLLVGVISVAGALLVGTAIGMVAGLRSRSLLDTLLMRSMDVVLAFPLLVLVPVLAGLFVTGGGRAPGGLGQILILSLAIGVVLVPTFARIARASVLAEASEDYVTAARSFGARTRDLLLRNLLPNIQAPLIVQAAFSIALAIIVEAAVSFLGLGVQPPQSSWGNMLADAQSYVLLGAWWMTVFPVAAIALAVLGFNLLGDGLRDALDPRAQAAAGGDDALLGGAG